MADISLFEDDYEDSGGDGVDSGLGYNYDSYGTDYHLTPLQKMEKYMDSDNGYHRTMVAKNLTDTLRWAVETESDADASAILACLARLSEDPEATVRLELMDQIPHIATYFHENPDIFGGGVPFMSNYVLPITCRYLTDEHHLVRKTGQAALLVLLEQELIDKDDFEEQVCPVMLKVTSLDNYNYNADNYDELKIEAIALMSKMAPLVGQDITIRMFMDRFTELCTDSLFHVRKVCASNFGDLCTVVGQDQTETVLLPKFKLLCEDRVWGIRRSCAECFMAVSCCVSQEVRVRELSCLFLQLLGDPSSRWVRQAAFQALGGFISTFADPNSTGLYFNDQGILVAGNQEYPSPTQSITPSQSPTQSSESNTDTSSTTPPSNESSSNTTQSESTESENAKLQENNNTNAECECSAPASGGEVNEEAPNSPGQASVPEDLQGEVIQSTSNSGADTIVQDMEIDVEVEGGASEVTTEITTEGNGSKELSPEESRAQHIADSNSGSDSGITQPIGAANSPSINKAASVSGPSTTSSQVPSNKTDTKIGENQAQKPRQSGTESFNSFQYWREPLPEITVDSEFKLSDSVDPQQDSVVESGSPSRSSQPTDGTEQDEASLSVFMADLSSLDQSEEYVANIGSTHVLGQHVGETTMTVVNGIVQDIGGQNIHWETTSSEDDGAEEGHHFRREPEIRKQDVIPQALLDHYVSMTDNVHIQTTDQDIARHCAYSLPAVAYTLGQKFWPCLQDLYETLASDMQWKVRRTLAFSIHELAVILGEEITNDDLVPVFNGFLKDLDEVRIGVLKHFADFLKLLKPERRREYLTKIPEFLNVDNNRNWRFREELATQVIFLTELFSAEDGEEHLLPVGILLAEDKVSVVRRTAFKVLASVLKRFAEEDKVNKDSNLVAAFVADVIPRFAHSHQWSQRQIFAQLCEEILADDAISKEQFAVELLPDLLSLANDSIPNVRIAVAKVLAFHVLQSEYFTSPSNPEHERLLKTQQNLQSDKDRDVRYFIQDNCDTSLITSQDQMIPV